MPKKRTYKIKQVMASVNPFLEEQIKKRVMNLKRKLKEIENKIVNLTTRFKVDRAGIITKANTFKKAQGIHQDIINIFEEIFTSTAKVHLKNLIEVEKFAKKLFKELGVKQSDLSNRSKKFIKQVKKQIETGYKALAFETERKLSDKIYNAVISKTSFSHLQDEIKGIIRGQEGINIKSLSAYITVYEQDSVMRYYASLIRERAKAAKLKYFYYAGNIAGTSRPFCIVRVGRIFSEAEINGWDGLFWKGKAGTVWVDRGGYNCRHHFIPIKKEWMDDVEVEVQDYFKEADGYPEKLKPAINKQRKLMESVRSNVN